MADLATVAFRMLRFLPSIDYCSTLTPTVEPSTSVTRQYCLGRFAELTPNIPSVAYFSATAAIAEPVVKTSLPVFWVSHGILAKYEGPNDGFVSVESGTMGRAIISAPTLETIMHRLGSSWVGLVWDGLHGFLCRDFWSIKGWKGFINFALPYGCVVRDSDLLWRNHFLQQRPTTPTSNQDTNHN